MVSTESTNFWDFSSELLKELIDEGLKGKELLKEFEKRKEMVKEVFALMLEEANLEIEQGKGKGAEELFAELYQL